MAPSPRVVWQDAVQGGQEAILLVEVTAGARQAAFPSGYNEWRGRIGIQVRAPAQAGQANREVCAAVADFFQLPSSAVRVVAGPADPRKSLLVPLPRDDAVRRLAEVL